jgi:hypothetical protein
LRAHSNIRHKIEAGLTVPNEEHPTTLELAIRRRRAAVNRIIWIIGAIVVVLAILSFLGLR